MRTPLSVLSLASISAEGTIASAFKNVVDFAQAAERFGYHRFWIAEHHNIQGVASSATAILIGHVAQKTSSIRVGSGGVMLPNHAPLMVAEAFGTLETLYPNRIDLGLGRAPGTDPLTTRALRRETKMTGREFPDLVEELQLFLAPAQPGQGIQAIPGAGLDIPLWILGSSLWSADFAASVGLPYAFAAHFAPADLMDALEIYRSRFKPSSTLSKPKVMVCIPVVAAPTDEEANFLVTTTYQRILGLITGRRPPASPPPVKSMDLLWTTREKAGVESFLAELIVGGPETVRRNLLAFQERTKADEIMVHTELHQKVDTIRSLEITAQAWA